jgi:hypothetical protein
MQIRRPRPPDLHPVARFPLDALRKPELRTLSPMSAPALPRVLVTRRLDGWLVGWFAVAVWVIAYAADHGGLALQSGGSVAAVIGAVGLVITAAHFGLSYHLAYSGGAPALRARPFALVIGPAVLVAVLGAVVVLSLLSGTAATDRVTGALITAVFLLTTWHYIKQVYGVARVGAAFAGVRLGQWDTRVLRYGLYPLWFLGAAQVLVRGSTFGLGGFHYGYQVLPRGALDALRVLVVCAAVPIAAVFVRLAVRTGNRPPGVLVAPYVAAFLWLGLPVDPVLTVLVLSPFHALQYLAVGHRAELAVAADRPGKHGLAWWLTVFGGAAAGGMLLNRWLPRALDAHVHGRSGQLLFAIAFFVFVNLHHYLIDASIWRSKGELVKAMVRKPGPAAASAPAEPARAPLAEPAQSEVQSAST